MFDRDQFDLLLQDLRAVLNTEIVMDDGQLLYDTTNGGPDAVNRLRAASVSYSAPSKERRRAADILGLSHREPGNQRHIFRRHEGRGKAISAR